MNLNVGCFTSGTQPATAPFISCTVADGWNGIDTIVTVASTAGTGCDELAADGTCKEWEITLLPDALTSF